MSGDHIATVNFDYGYHYYGSNEKYCLVNDEDCKVKSDRKDMVGRLISISCIVLAFLLVGCIIWKTLKKSKMRTEFKGKWSFLNDTDLTGREGKKLVKNLRKVSKSFTENPSEEFVAKFDTKSDSDDSADDAYGNEDATSENSEHAEAR